MTDEPEEPEDLRGITDEEFRNGLEFELQVFEERYAKLREEGVPYDYAKRHAKRQATPVIRKALRPEHAAIVIDKVLKIVDRVYGVA